jgi:hypothetical protein
MIFQSVGIHVGLRHPTRRLSHGLFNMEEEEEEEEELCTESN